MNCREFPEFLHEYLFGALPADQQAEFEKHLAYTLFQLAAHFPRYLVETRPDGDEADGLPADWPDFLIDLDTLELTFNEVFDGPGVEGERLLEAEPLRAIAA